MNYKMLADHAPDCGSVREVQRGHWDTVWCLDGKWHWLDKAARRRKHGGNTPWIELKCNCTGCPARCLVRHDDICKLGPLPSEGSGNGR